MAKTLRVEDGSPGIFEPDILMPAQYFRSPVPSWTGEYRLLRAVLSDAVTCYQKPTRGSKSRAVFLETEAWFASRESTETFSFEHICQVLGFNPDYIRRGLRMMTKRTISRRHHDGGPSLRGYQERQRRHQANYRKSVG